MICELHTPLRNSKAFQVMTGDAGNMRVLLENSERHELHVRYRDPVLFRIASFISILTILIIILILLTRGFRGGACDWTDAGCEA